MIRSSTARRYFDPFEVQVSEQAAALLAVHADDLLRQVAGRAVRLMEEENGHRRAQGLSPRRRVQADDVRRAMER